MMDTITAIQTRRSIRKFSQANIPKETIDEWLCCGMLAPSAGNQQPWHFIVIKNTETLKQIPRFHAHAQMLTDASCAILICYDTTLEKHKGMAVQDCSAATQNILLAIHDHGYGAVWLGVYPLEKRMKGLIELLKIPDGIIPFSLIAIGKPDERKDTVDRYQPTRVHQEKW